MTSEELPTIVTPKPSATVVVMREGKASPEVLLVKRRAGDAFGDSYAFPGGVVDANEDDAITLSTGISESQANALLDLELHGLHYYSAGVRELFEETGILLARDEDNAWAHCDSDVAEYRLLVDRGVMHWADFLRQMNVKMAFDSMHYFAHWITPVVRPKRWTTRFFICELPEGQSACHDGTETTDSRWISANDALEESRAGNLEIPYPTRKTLTSLRDLGCIAELKPWAIARQDSGIESIRPDHIVAGEPR